MAMKYYSQLFKCDVSFARPGSFLDSSLSGSLVFFRKPLKSFLSLGLGQSFFSIPIAKNQGSLTSFLDGIAGSASEFPSIKKLKLSLWAGQAESYPVPFEVLARRLLRFKLGTGVVIEMFYFFRDAIPICFDFVCLLRRFVSDLSSNDKGFCQNSENTITIGRQRTTKNHTHTKISTFVPRKQLHCAVNFLSKDSHPWSFTLQLNDL
ncbi:hypothetical protein F2Q69_00062126 [Brassica cretica]|uniref:Uncharacterized protein n=1 Tax=Brassica cretica TaxID=69181 RepID=A0A8S9RKD3_BRACR|nr:hypothetical protein F2Q69_00062126 [Brassica cretica]